MNPISTQSNTGFQTYTPTNTSSSFIDGLSNIGSSLVNSSFFKGGSANTNYTAPFGYSSIQNMAPGPSQLNVSPKPMVASSSTSIPAATPVSSPYTGVYQSTGVNAGINPYTLQPYDTPPAYTPPSNLSPKNFNVDMPSTIDSSHLGSSYDMNSLLDNHVNSLTGLMNGTNMGVPSDSLLSELAGKIYTASQYSPDEQGALQNLADINSRINVTNLAARRQIQQLQEDGQITKDQAAAFISDSQRRSDQQLADLATAQSAQSNTLGVLGQIRGNQLTAYQNLAGLLQPTQVSPGSSLYNPITGVNYQGGGGSPQAILSYAQQLIQNDQSQGTLRTTPTGQIDTNYYQQAAQMAFSGGSLGNSMGSTQGGSGTNQLQSVAQMLVNGTLSPSNIPAGLNQAVVLQAANQLSLQTTGQPFDANKAQANYGATQAALTQNATTFRALSNAQSTAVSHLNDLQTYFDALPASSKTSITPLNGASNWIASIFGSGAVQSYNTTLQAARGEIAKVLAGGGAPSDSENQAAKSVLPDNMTPGQISGAINAAKLLMQQKIQEYSNTNNVPQYGQTQTSTTGGVVQTKVGDIPTNW